MATRLRTNSAGFSPSDARSMSMLTTTPPTGMPNSWNQLMKRVITAIGSASGNVALGVREQHAGVPHSVAKAEQVVEERVLWVDKMLAMRAVEEFCRGVCDDFDRNRPHRCPRLRLMASYRR